MCWICLFCTFPPHFAFSAFLLSPFSFSTFSRLLLYFPTSFAHYSICLSKQNPQIIDTTSAVHPQNPQSPAHPQNPHSPAHPQLQIGGASSHPIHSSAPLSSLFSSNPYSNQRHTHIQSNSAVLHLFSDDSATLLLFHSKSATPPTIFRFSLYIWLMLIWVYIISLNFVGLWYYCFVWVLVLIYLTN